MLRQDFSRQPRPILSHRLGTFIGGDWQVSARTIRIGACALIYDSPQFGLCIANGDEMALAAFILSGSARQAPALHKILNTALRIMVMNARDPDNAFPQVLSYCARALPRVELTAREAARLTELNQLIQREASAQTRARAMARWSAEDRLFADSESGKTQERDDHGRYTQEGGAGKAPDFQKAAKWLNDHAVEKYGEHKCMEHVQKAVKREGIDVGHSGSAKDAGPAFEKADFVKVPDDGNYKVGDVVIFSQPGNGISNDGHIAMWDGRKWVSDYVQDDMYPSNQAKKNNASHSIYRYSSKLRGELRE